MEGRLLQQVKAANPTKTVDIISTQREMSEQASETTEGQAPKIKKSHAAATRALTAEDADGNNLKINLPGATMIPQQKSAKRKSAKKMERKARQPKEQEQSSKIQHEAREPIRMINRKNIEGEARHVKKRKTSHHLGKSKR